MLERLQRKGNPTALLVGMQTGEATVENSMEFPQKAKNGTPLVCFQILPAITSSRSYSKLSSYGFMCKKMT